MLRLSVLAVAFTFSGSSLLSQTRYAVSYDGLRIAYTDTGRGDVTLLFVHGWSCDRSYWSGQVGPLSASYRVVTVDLAGHGESDTVRVWWTMQGFGEDIVSVIDTLRLTNVVLVGHSAAGYSCLEAARMRPERVVALVGVDAYRFIVKGYFDRRITVREMERSAESMRKDFAGSIDRLVRTRFFGPNAPPELVDRVAKDMASAPQSVAIPAGTYAFSTYRSDHLQGAFTAVGTRIPILAYNGAERGQIDSTVVQEVAPLFTVRYMTDAGHFLMMEKPEEFNEELVKFVKHVRGEQ